MSAGDFNLRDLISMHTADRHREVVEERDRLRSFSPTAQHINALPESLRRYIHDIETRCDPAGDIRELTITKDENRMLRAKCERYERERESLRRRVEDCELALRVWDQGGESEYWVRHREGGV